MEKKETSNLNILEESYQKYKDSPLSAQLALSMTPGIGEAIAVREAKDEYDKGNLGLAALAGIGAIPALGYGARLARGLGKGIKAVTKSDEVSKSGLKSIKDIPDDELDLEDLREKYKVSQRQKRVPEVQEAAEKLYEGKLTKEDYDRVVTKYQPITKITEMPEVPSLKRIKATLNKNKVETGIVGENLDSSSLQGKRVASRLDIPAYDNYDTWIVSLHDGTKQGGKAIGYGQSAVLKNVNFISSEKGALNIARGKTPKSTIARIYGDYEDVPVENVYNKVQKELNNPKSEYIQVGMNPFRHSYFYNKVTGEPVVSASEILQIGPLVLAKGIKKIKPTDYKFEAGGMVEKNTYNYNTQRTI
tara:strand:- start:620 stop:1702 length:1083 start_codon:yes stop_codon:yes gene_type:complete